MHSLSKSNYVLVSVFLVASIFSFSLLKLPSSTIKASFNNSKFFEEDFVPTDSPNTPIGTARGIFPGRVIWCYNPNATNWSGVTKKSAIDGKSGATEIKPNGNWYLEGNIIQNQVDLMIAESIRKLSCKGSDAHYEEKSKNYWVPSSDTFLYSSLDNPSKMKYDGFRGLPFFLTS